MQTNPLKTQRIENKKALELLNLRDLPKAKAPKKERDAAILHKY